MSVSCLMRRFMIQASSCFPGTFPCQRWRQKMIMSRLISFYFTIRHMKKILKVSEISLHVAGASHLLWDLFRCIAPWVTGGVALLGGSAVPHVSLLSIPLAARQVQLFTSTSPSVLHRFGGWKTHSKRGCKPRENCDTCLMRYLYEVVLYF